MAHGYVMVPFGLSQQKGFSDPHPFEPAQTWVMELSCAESAACAATQAYHMHRPGQPCSASCCRSGLHSVSWCGWGSWSLARHLAAGRCLEPRGGAAASIPGACAEELVSECMRVYAPQLTDASRAPVLSGTHCAVLAAAEQQYGCGYVGASYTGAAHPAAPK